MEVPSAFHHLHTAVTDAVSQGANLAALPWAPEGRRWRREETEPSLRSCWRGAQRLYSAGGGWHPAPLPCPLLVCTAPLGALSAFSAGPDFEGSALPKKMPCSCLLSNISALSLLPSFDSPSQRFVPVILELFLIIIYIFN